MNISCFQLNRNAQTWFVLHRNGFGSFRKQNSMLSLVVECVNNENSTVLDRVHFWIMNSRFQLSIVRPLANYLPFAQSPK